tara:strand:- start:82 stop:2262 length:2181 start_codon:yes stop_codon:yes gene_type:complete
MGFGIKKFVSDKIKRKDDRSLMGKLISELEKFDKIEHMTTGDAFVKQQLQDHLLIVMEELFEAQLVTAQEALKKDSTAAKPLVDQIHREQTKIQETTEGNYYYIIKEIMQVTSTDFPDFFELQSGIDFILKLVPFDEGLLHNDMRSDWELSNYDGTSTPYTFLMKNKSIKMRIEKFQKYADGFYKKHSEISEIIYKIHQTPSLCYLNNPKAIEGYERLSYPFISNWAAENYSDLPDESKNKIIENFSIEESDSGVSFTPNFFIDYEKFWNDHGQLVQLAMSEFEISPGIVNLILIEKHKKVAKQIHHETVNKISKTSMTKNDCIREFLEVYPNDWKMKTSILESAFRKNSISFDGVESEVNSYLTSVKRSRFKESLLGDTPDYEIENIDVMGGIEFEEFLSKLFTKMGYLSDVTQSSGDQGADLIIEKNGKKTVVQAKRYSDNVSNSAIQEAVAALKHYDCDSAMVVTTSNFTKGAKELAKSNNVQLIDRVKLKKLLETYPIPNQDFDDDSEIDIEDDTPSSKSVNYEGKDLSEKDLDGKNFSNCDLSKTKLPDIIENTNFTGANFSGGNKLEGSFEYCNFKEANLSNCVVAKNYCAFTDCDLTGTDMSNSDFSTCGFFDQDFSKANLSNSNFTKCDMEDCNFSGANLENANLSKISFTEIDFSKANMKGVNLTKSNLSSCNLSGANLTGADLTNADLSYADLKDADLSDAILTGTNLDDTILEKE